MKFNLCIFLSDQILTINFMRKYIHIARHMKVKLTEEACKVIADEYSKLRSEDSMESDVARVSKIIFSTLHSIFSTKSKSKTHPDNFKLKSIQLSFLVIK